MRLHAEENVVAQPPIDLHYPQPLAQALQRLAERQRGPQRHLRPVGIIGPGDGGAQVCAAAREVACALAQAGMAIVCGGRGGVMAAASQGAREGGGIRLGRGRLACSHRHAGRPRWSRRWRLPPTASRTRPPS